MDSFGWMDILEWLFYAVAVFFAYILIGELYKFAKDIQRKLQISNELNGAIAERLRNLDSEPLVDELGWLNTRESGVVGNLVKLNKTLSDLNETTQSILYNVGRVSDRVDEIAESNTKFQDS